jgi:hypothetical protein
MQRTRAPGNRQGTWFPRVIRAPECSPHPGYALQCCMTQITLVLPFALPPPELAPDLVRALQAPALAALLTRASAAALPFDDSLRVLPHEAWLAQTLGLSPDGQPAYAAAVMRGFGLDPGADSWFIINPAHIDIARNHLSIGDMRRLQLDEKHARALFNTARPLFDELGKTLLYGDPSTWFMRAGDWNTLQTASPDAAVGLNLTDWLPGGPCALQFRKLQNEVQMLWFEHAANIEREARGLQPINSFWPWAMAESGAAVATTAAFATAAVPAWLAALANCPAPALPNPFGGNAADSLFVRGDLCQAAIGADWSGWLGHMHRLEQTLFAPALAALMQGHNAKLKLVLGNRHSHQEFVTTKWAQHAFWRRPTLNRLLP